MSNEVIVSKVMFEPTVGMTSLVGIYADKYPLSFGNYCSINGGPYLVNFWAENLTEWRRRNPSVETIEVTVVEHPKTPSEQIITQPEQDCWTYGGFRGLSRRAIGFVSDPRMLDWRNDKLCITGNGWPTVAVCRKVCELLNKPTDNWLCGCEADDVAPYVCQHSSYDEDFAKRITTNVYQYCKREWNHVRTDN